jgi:Arc/MetJ-type ribon-helix-helix transcriptional regulator
MSYAFPPDVARLVQEQMATGSYSSEDDVLRVALTVLGQCAPIEDEDAKEFRETVAAVQESIADMEAGRMRPIEELIEEARHRPNDEI